MALTFSSTMQSDDRDLLFPRIP